MSSLTAPTASIVHFCKDASGTEDVGDVTRRWVQAKKRDLARTAVAVLGLGEWPVAARLVHLHVRGGDVVDHVLDEVRHGDCRLGILDRKYEIEWNARRELAW